jgi:hypothetical protein
MKLVETDTATPADDVEEEIATPPRPEHRRVSVSLLFTLLVLVGTVTTIYLVFPERHNALIEAATAAHTSSEELELASPTQAELRAFALALLGREVPWPELRPGVELVGVHATSVLNRPAVLVKYRVDGAPVTVLVQRPRDALPQIHRRTEDGIYSVSWRRGKLTFIAVGPADEPGWRELFGAP